MLDDHAHAGRAEHLVDEGADRLEHGDADGALAFAARALAIAPGDVTALHLKATALDDLGHIEDASAAYAEALDTASDDLDLLAAAADFYLDHAEETRTKAAWLDQALALAARGLKVASRAGDENAVSEFARIEAAALATSGRPAEGLARLETAIARHRDNLDLLTERGAMLFELCRFEEARQQFRAIDATDPHDPWVNHALGLIAERFGEEDEAQRRFSAAHAAAPEDFPVAPRLSSEAFDAAVEDALADLPANVRAYLSNVAIVVEDLPGEDDLLESDPPLSPSILGIFRGAPLGEKASMDPWSHFPSSIVLYQRNLERFAVDREDLVEEIGVTLLHEVGHFLGLDEDDLRERGLE